MSLESTTQTINSYLNALFNGGDFGQFFTDDVRWTTMETGDEIQGREAVRDFIAALHREVFDAHPEVRNLAIADGLAALEADFVGVHAGEFAGIAPTGAAVRVPYCVSMTSARTASLPFAGTCRWGSWSHSSKALQLQGRSNVVEFRFNV